MAALSEVDLALRVRALSSLVQPSFLDQRDGESNALALRLSALLDLTEDLVHRQPQLQRTLESISDWQTTLDHYLTPADGITKNDPYYQLSMVLDGADDLRKFLSDMERCKELNDRGVMELSNLAGTPQRF
ncbi:hypothetical protein MPSI1_001814 [Malassezia psittaci]|uniref:Uncharacterized protein n=1 Tax=Malassezia psittaci TaxID=1821823 RepID=A0AAF0F516_9BASI|nr:hypothetical protein MPSI1_001814 [Malassezia psittaci]